MTRPGEDALIARYFAPLVGPGGLGLLDDAALITPRPDHDLVLTADGLVAGVHFFPDDPPGSIARKALGVNLSDLAAKGADPVGFLLTLALPDDWTAEWLAAFADGLRDLSSETGCQLFGGDTVRAAGPLSISITAVGAVPTGRMVRRTTARAGDRLCVSGTIGDSVLGLAILAGSDPDVAAVLTPSARAYAVDRYHHPQPRLGLARALRTHAGAAMDVSDGLVGDLTKMMRVSGVGARIDLSAVPFSPAGLAAIAIDPAWRDRLVTGGDDYEILAAVAPERLGAFLQDAEQAGIPVTVIGDVTADPGTRFEQDGHPHAFERESYGHF